MRGCGSGLGREWGKIRVVLIGIVGLGRSSLNLREIFDVTANAMLKIGGKWVDPCIPLNLIHHLMPPNAITPETTQKIITAQHAIILPIALSSIIHDSKFSSHLAYIFHALTQSS